MQYCTGDRFRREERDDGVRLRIDNNEGSVLLFDGFELRLLVLALFGKGSEAARAKLLEEDAAPPARLGGERQAQPRPL